MSSMNNSNKVNDNQSGEATSQPVLPEVIVVNADSSDLQLQQQWKKSYKGVDSFYRKS